MLAFATAALATAAPPGETTTSPFAWLAQRKAQGAGPEAHVFPGARRKALARLLHNGAPSVHLWADHGTREHSSRWFSVAT